MHKISSAAITLAALIFSASCEKDPGPNNNPDNGSVSGQYIISASVDESNILLQTPTLDSGSLTTQYTGLETDAGSIWYFYGDSYLYRLQYNQGNVGVTTSYVLNSEGQIEQRSNTYTISRFTTYGALGPHIITISAGDTDHKDAQGNAAQGLLFNFLDVANQSNSTRSQVCENFLGNGEYVTFSGILSSGGKVYTSVVGMGMSKYGVSYDGGSLVTYPELVATESGGSGSGSYDIGEIPVTQFPDSAWVAIFDNQNFTDPTILRTDKIGFASGRNRSQYYQTIWAADNGDIYVFSPGYARNHSGPFHKKGEKPSGVVRINAGTEAFDENYYYNIEELSGGYAMFRCWHITQDYFFLQMYTGGTAEQDAIGGIGGGTNAAAVFKASTGEFKYISGLPAQDNITSIGGIPFVENGYIYISIVTNDGEQPAVYKINPSTAEATRGVTVSCSAISALGKLSVL